MTLLDTFIAAHRYTPFIWGVHDCYTFAADWVLARTGRDPLAGVRGYCSARQALRILLAHGGQVRAWSLWHGQPITTPLMAQAGDLCMMPSGYRGALSRHTLGICTGRHVACPGRDALRFVPIDQVEATWRVA